ncbi:MAG: hypothetical protein J6A74_04200 [Oscillospiraceae bacterium]|nr:hypothetical protein [Oscillospiraceae bacterium]
MRRRFVCVLMVVVLLYCTGCSLKGDLTGTWEAEVDALHTVVPNLPEGLSVLKLGAIPVEIVLTLTEDGAFTLTVKQESIQKAEENLWQRVEKLLGEKDGEVQGAAASLEGLLGSATDQLKETLEQVLEDARIEEKITEAYTRNGTYDYDGKQLLLTDQNGDTFLTSKCLLIGDKLTLTAPFPGVALLTMERNKG